MLSDSYHDDPATDRPLAAENITSPERARAWYEVYLQEEHFVHGIDDTPEMVVNPVQLQRMTCFNRAAASAGEQRRAKGLQQRNKPSSWGHLGISIGVRSSGSDQLEQLKKLQGHLAATEGVSLPADVTLQHHI